MIERVRPQVDGGRFAIKRVVGETVGVEAQVFADGHDQISCQILYWQDRGAEQSAPMKPLGNDLWRGQFSVGALGRYHYTVEGWIDRFLTWRTDLTKRIAAGQDVHVEMLIGAQLLEDSAMRTGSGDADQLRQWAHKLRAACTPERQQAVAFDEELLSLVRRYPERHLTSRYERELPVIVDREKARFSAWYEVFP